MRRQEEEEVERRPYLSPRKESSALKSILRQGHMETTERLSELRQSFTGNIFKRLLLLSPYLVHVGVKVGPILKVDLHCWVHVEG